MFQQTIVQKYLKAVDPDKLANAWAQYQAHFLNPAIQENIRNSKEEQYQGEFLIDLFVKVLGYTKNPTPGFNITTELKNVQDSNTDRQVDQMVYKLYDLTEEEVAIVENS